MVHKGWFASMVVTFVVSSFGAGCAVASSEEGDAPAAPAASARGAQALTSDYDGVTVVGERDAAGIVRAEARNAKGEALLVLRVEGERLVIDPRSDRSLAPWSGAVPAAATASNELSDWNYLAYAYSQRLSPAPAGGARDTGDTAQAGAVQPQMMSAGTDGQMCIAAGGTAAECAYWLYCRRHWCPFW